MPIGARHPRPISVWAHAQHALKRGAHRFSGAESAASRDRIDARLGVLEELARRFDARALHEAGGRDTELVREDAEEVPRTHGDPAGERRNTEVLLEVLDDPAPKVAQGTPLREPG